MFKSIFGRKEDDEPGGERRTSLSQSLIESFSGMKVKQNIEVESTSGIKQIWSQPSSHHIKSNHTAQYASDRLQ